MTPTHPAVLALVRDLMFSSKISSAGTAAGRAVRVLRDPALLPTMDAALLIVDLSQPSFIEPATQWQRRTGGRVIGFAGHVDTAALSTGEAAGFEVMTNGALTGRLPALMAGLPG